MCQPNLNRDVILHNMILSAAGGKQNPRHTWIPQQNSQGENVIY